MLQELITQAVSDLADFIRCYEPVFLYLQVKKAGQNGKDQIKRLNIMIETSKKRIADLDKLFNRIYEDNLNGKISDERYSRMATEYESEQKELETLVASSQEKLLKAEKQSVDMRMLLEGFREFTDMKTLTPTIVNKLIHRIEVHNSDKSSGHIKVKVDIYFTAVGLVNIPTEQQLLHLMEEAKSEMEKSSKTA